MISDPAVKHKLVQTFPFLSHEGSSFSTRFLQAASVAHLTRGEYVCHEGRECPHLALVLEGTARVYKLGENGREITLYRVETGQCCILTASCIINRKPFPAFAVCEENIKAAVLPNREVTRWIAEHAEWRNYLFSLISERLTDIISVVEEVVFRRMDRRIADYLLKSSHRAAVPVVKVTHQQIASDLGTSREVVSRILKDFESDRLIRVSRGAIQVKNLQALDDKCREP